MQFPNFPRVRSAWVIAAVAMFAAACDRSDEPFGPSRAVSRAPLTLSVSSASVPIGGRIAVAVVTEPGSHLGGIQGTIHFGPSDLRYIGQVRTQDQIDLVNDHDAATGALHFATLNPNDIRRAGIFIFEVRAAGYTTAMSFTADEAGLNGSPVSLVRADVASGVAVDPSLSISGNAQRISVLEWRIALDAKSDPKGLLRDPGEVRHPLRFGDTNFDGALTLSDALYLINISVGLNEMIVGTDGTGATGDRDAVIAGNVLPFNAPGLGEPSDALAPGVEADGSRNITLGDAIAVINESVGIDQPVVGEIIPGREATVASNRIMVTADITTDQTWTPDNVYELERGVMVTGGATLTILPGTRIEGVNTAPGGALFVQRDGRIVADGTRLQPIVFTCTSAVKSKGCWGGLVINGNAGLNESSAGAPPSPVVPGRAPVGGCLTKNGEGSSGNYGGCNDADSSGVLRYVVVEYGGFRFNSENELNNIALQGVGSHTVIDFVQAHAGLDDGMEFFGGTPNVKHLVLTANEDDSFDWVEGYRGKAQFIIIQHDPLDSDKGFEGDNTNTAFDNLPRSTPTIFNVTMIGKPDPASTAGIANNNSVAAFNIRRGTRPHIFNVYAQNWTSVMDVDDEATCVDFGTATGFELKNSIFTQNLHLDEQNPTDVDPVGCNGSEAGVLSFAAGNNQFIAASTLLDPLNFIVPDWRPAAGTATGGATPPNDGFFDPTATFVGAVPPANATKSNIPWYSGWTRGWQSATTP